MGVGVSPAEPDERPGRFYVSVLDWNDGLLLGYVAGVAGWTWALGLGIGDLGVVCVCIPVSMDFTCWHILLLGNCYFPKDGAVTGEHVILEA